MEKGMIRKLNKELSEELRKMEDYFIVQAEDNTDYYLNVYKSLPSSFNGNYVCSDLFKETYKEYTKDIESRKKYAEVVHNSAAVLANHLFHLNVEKGNIKKCIFVSGVPGAGKSFLIQSLLLNDMIDENTMIYEGDISSLSIHEKIQTIVDNGIEPYIIIVNPTLELAQRNAIMRHFEIGRGASCQTMARIISKIPEALKVIKEKFPDVELGIYNKKTNYEIDNFIGFENINLLNHGSYDEILAKLEELRLVILEEIEENIKKKLTERDDIDENGRKR